MAMLAERRQKVKWVLNPRQTAWSNDSNKFGQKYLEKLGWKAGQGIGANLQGCTEHIKVSVRSDNRGIGFKGVPEDVLPHQNDFSNLLAQLASNVPSMETEPNVEKSLEVKSRRSKARVHYHKFTRSKDLTMYSQKDLTCILGKPTMPNKDPVDEQDSTLSEANFVQQGDMQAYFTKKMKHNSVDFVKENATNVKMYDCDQDSNSYTGFGFNKNIDNLASSAQQNKEEELNEFVKKLEKKRKKHRESTKKINNKSGCLEVDFSTSPNKDPVDKQDSTLLEANFVQQGGMQAYFAKKMKHNSVDFVKENAPNVKIYDCDEDSNSYTGFGFNKNIHNLTSAQQNKEEELNEFVKKLEKKRKKHRESTEKLNNESGCLEVDFSTSLSVIKDVEPDGHTKKSRKKRKICAKLTETEDNLLDVGSTEFEAHTDVQSEAEKCSDKLRKKRKVNRHADVTDGESLLPKKDHIIDQEMGKSDSIKKSGKRRKENQSEVTDRIEEDRLQSLCDSNVGELSRHKKKLKRKQNCSNENVSVDYGCDINEDLSKSVEISSKKKKKCEKIAASVNEDPLLTTVGSKKIQLLEVEETFSDTIKKQRKKLRQTCQYIEMKSDEEDGGISVSRKLNENIDESSVSLRKRKKKRKKDEVLEKVECDGLSVAECTQNLLSDEVDVTEKGKELSKKQRNYCGAVALSEVNNCSQKKRMREAKECIEMYNCANWLPLIDTCETVQAVKNNKPNENTELLRSKVKKIAGSEPTYSEFLPNVSCNKRNIKHTRCSEPQFNDVLVSSQEKHGTVDCRNIHQKLNEGKLAYFDTRNYVTSQQTEAIEEQQGCTIISEVNALGSNENLYNNANHVKSKKQLVVLYESVKYVKGISEHNRRLPRRCWYSNDAMKTIPQWERNDVFDGFPGSNVERLSYG